MSTILKWAGNKTAIMPELIKHLPAGPRLVEPFAGSCCDDGDRLSSLSCRGY
jgi:DNA adenine methylase